MAYDIDKPFIEDHDTFISDKDKADCLNFMMNYSQSISYFILEDGTINFVAILAEIQAMKDKQYLDQHKYAITQLPNGRWQTFLPADNDRRQVRRVKKDDLIKEIIAYYKKLEEVVTVESVAYEWLSFKRMEPGFKNASYDRYENQYKRLFSSIGDKAFSELNDTYMEDYLIAFIIKERITQRAWADLRIVIRGIFKYAKRHGYTTILIEDVLEVIAAEKKVFTPTKKKTHHDEVFTDEEVDRIFEYIDGRGPEKVSIVDLGIKLAFSTGLRAGELAGLKYADFNTTKKSVIITRTEQHSKDANGHNQYYFSQEGILKCDHGAETLYLTSNAIGIYEQIKCMGSGSEFLFYTDHFIRSQAFTKRLIYICKKIGIPPRSLHKARKTYATRLINNGVSDAIVQTQLRHSDISTTRKFYYFDNTNDDSKADIIEKAIGQY